MQSKFSIIIQYDILLYTEQDQIFKQVYNFHHYNN